MYDIFKNGTTNLLSVNLSPEVGDGPRNVFPSKDGKWLYVVGVSNLPAKRRASLTNSKAD